MTRERNRRLIVIDDNESIHHDFRRIFVKEDAPSRLSEIEAVMFGAGPSGAGEIYTMGSAYQGEEGFDLVKNAAASGSPYAIAFVDMRMPPGWDGLRTIEKIWEVDREIQIVLCTAYSDHSHDDLWARFGATDRLLVLKKPFDVAEVRQLAAALTEKWDLARRAEALRSSLAESAAAAWSAKEQLDELLDSASDLILSTDLEGRLLYVNRAWRETLGYDADDLSRVGLLDILSEGSRAAWKGAFERLIRGEPKAQVEALCHCKDGRTVTIDGTVTCRFERGEPVAMRAILRDVTHQKFKDEFISSVSHELRTPMTSIRGSLALLEAGVQGPLPDGANELVQIARVSVERLIRLINNLLDLEKLEAGSVEYKRADVDVPKLVTSSLGGVRALADAAGVELRAASVAAGTVHADEDRLVQVLTNLLSNAIKFSPAGGVVEVKVEPTGAQAIRFAVIDRGPGIAEGDTGKLFGRFQQLSSDGAAKGGTGLGLAISKAIVKQHGGSIGVESRTGVGSTFWFELPAA